MDTERVVITGIGAVSCNGIDAETFVHNVNHNISGIRECTRYDVSELRSQMVGEIDYEPLYDALPNEDEIERTVYLAYYATERALADSGLDLASLDKNVVFVIGSLFGGYNTSTYVHNCFLEDSALDDINVGILDYFSACSIPNYLSKKFGLKGAKIVVSNACSSGGSAVGIAYDLIKAGLADMAIAGGTDELNRLSLAGFNSLGALSPENCTPYTNSTGINIGEGAGIFILEKLSDAKARGYTPKAEIIGYELNSDAFHVTAPDPNGEGAYRAMKGVLERAHISIEELSYINGHGTGTNANDTSEIKSAKRLFAGSETVGKLTSNKGVIGHCMGAAGALELFISTRSITDGIIPPTYHSAKKKELADIHIVENAEEDPCRFILSNSFAFGGNNVSVGISAPESFGAEQVNVPLLTDDIVITGVGCIGNRHTSFEEYLGLVENNTTEFFANEAYRGKYSSIYNGVIPEYDYRRSMSPDFFRKTDLISKLSIVSASSAIKDAGLKISRSNGERVGLIYGTGTGPISTIEQLNLDILNKGLGGMNAFFFPNSVNNAAPGYITMNTQIKGTTVTMNSGGATFPVNMLYARLVLLQGKADQVIVTVSDDYNEIYHAAYDKLGLLNENNKVEDFFVNRNTLILSPGSVSVVLERKQTAEARNARIYARLLGGALTGDCNAVNGLNFKSKALAETFDETLRCVGLTADELDVYFAGSTGIRTLDFLEGHRVLPKLNDTVVSSARQFCGYNFSMIPAYSALSAIAGFLGYPVHDVINKRSVNLRGDSANAMISSYAFGETFGNIVLSTI
jgi:3-oxoacyl-[acyl-carrier-protein] synthase II